MKKMKYVLAVLLILLAGCLTSKAEAAVTITIKNNRSHNLSIAFRWDGFDENHSRGWFTVKAGQSRTITISEAVYALTASGFGYYATGGGNTWKGSGDNGVYGWIQLKEAFRFTYFGDDVYNPKSGMQKVLYRRINLRETGNTRENGTAALTFNP